jgi:hypothetical protein
MSRVEVEKKVLNENQILAGQLRERYREQRAASTMCEPC